MTLTDFLLARIAETEERARADMDHFSDPDRLPMDRWVHRWMTEVLADCEAKRLVVAQYLEAMRMRDEIGPSGTMEQARTYMTMQTLGMALYSLAAKFAAVYAAHPDYQDEWAPELTTA